MRRLLVTVAVVLTACARSNECPELTPAPELRAQPYGGACQTTADCEAGLECLEFSTSLRLCSVPCSRGGAHCPENSGACLQVGHPDGICRRGCEPDGGCATGRLFSQCSDGTCTPRFCTRGGGCAGADAYCAGARCLEFVDDGGATEGIAVTVGWCFANAP